MADMDFIRPPALNKGDTIGIIAPSSHIEPDVLDTGVSVLRDYGFNVFIHPQTLAREQQSAGTAVEKAAALHQVFLDPEIKAVIGAGGGNRAVHLLDHLDYDLIRSNPKIYMGFSDSTALLSAFARKSGLVTFHGPLIKSLARTEPPCLDFAFSLLGGKAHDYPLRQAKCLKSGKGQGPLYGGTLSVLCSLIGTPYMPDLTGAILFLEDVNEELSRIDRMLWQLSQAAPFNQLAGLMFGEFINPLDTGRPYGFTLDDIIKQHTDGLDIPVVTNAPFGHGSLMYALPVGQQAHLEASAEQTTLSLPP
jgi:muramoyltetrapeptide carboxypeptidase